MLMVEGVSFVVRLGRQHLSRMGMVLEGELVKVAERDRLVHRFVLVVGVLSLRETV